RSSPAPSTPLSRSAVLAAARPDGGRDDAVAEAELAGARRDERAVPDDPDELAVVAAPYQLLVDRARAVRVAAAVVGDEDGGVPERALPLGRVEVDRKSVV